MAIVPRVLETQYLKVLESKIVTTLSLSLHCQRQPDFLSSRIDAILLDFAGRGLPGPGRLPRGRPPGGGPST